MLGGDYSVRPRPANNPSHYTPPLRASRLFRQPPSYHVDPLVNFPLEAKANWDYTRNERIIDLPVGMDVKDALAMVRADFAEFKRFSEDNIAKAVVDKDTKRALFTLQPVRTELSAALAQNDVAVGVGLKKVGDTQVAVTLADHQLRGMRRWEANDLGGGRISIMTEAYEIPRLGDGVLSTIGNGVGTTFMRGDQAAVWDNYFRNIDKAYFVGAGKIVPFQHHQYPDAIVNPFAEYFKDASASSASDELQLPGSTASPAQAGGNVAAARQLSPRPGGGIEAGANEKGMSREPLREEREGDPDNEQAVLTGKSAVPGDKTPAFALGLQWVSGLGVRHRVFLEGDKVTTQIQSSPEVIEAREKMARRIARRDFRPLSFGRNAGQEPELSYVAGFVDDLFNNPTRAFLGSYGAEAEVVQVNEDSAVVRYTIRNRSGLESASRLPKYGYKARKNDSPRPALTEMLSGQGRLGEIEELSDLIPRSILTDNAYDLFGPGPGSTNSQEIIWFDTLPIKAIRR